MMVERRYAADCRYLRRTIDSSRLDGPVVTLCMHPIREDFDCIGPFLDETPTDCGLWEEQSRTPHSARNGGRNGTVVP
ncbi:MAG: hypothetical protein ACR2PL_20055 [Dehalococcoidia bacterium]